ncbi:3-ketosteroid reductase [Blastomyces dermatitidis ER-3]|uniref:3-ketosteroid reductase n=1 Tax=Ajellomyces dermatitidis (strain ER-3 / ATCC MYA-2586) TaxID=559297 RepID=A0ABM9YGA3_AJEDR|nr:3-ketosteroid reductase [Blastomyces dermatitidis ER-3]EEQ85655.2 3-ketosteroid reductase [Blastomyces dermatitidis ER-3]
MFHCRIRSCFLPKRQTTSIAMDSDNNPPDSRESDETYILVTGTNSGLGFSICCRAIDEFFATRPESKSLTLLFTSRSSKKSAETLSQLQAHLNGSATKYRTCKDRVTLRPEHVDLANLLSVRALSRRLLTSLPKLDAVILNAGIAGFTGINWFKAIYLVLTDLVNAVTYPAEFTLSSKGVLVKKQTSQPDEPPLGNVFCSNVFGHYMLSHALMPLLSASEVTPGRIIWISSLEATSADLDLSDLQALNTRCAYQSSKRLTDVLALTSDLPGSSPWVDSYLSTSNPSATAKLQQNRTRNPNRTTAHSKPQIYIAHPGICGTGIMPLLPPLFYAMIAAFWLARMLGSPWHTISTYSGACAPVWLALTPQSVLDAAEGVYARLGGGKPKWGSSSDRLGRQSAVSTEVEGWGYGGVVGAAVLEGDKKRRRKDGATDLTAEEKVEFEELGRRCWREMEELRVRWEKILEKEEEARGILSGL